MCKRMPGLYCNVKGCKSNVSQSKNNDISYHSFPKNEVLKRQWIDFCQKKNNWVPKPHSKICSVHFKKNDFEMSYRKELLNIPTQRNLIKTAVPSYRESDCENTGVVEEIILRYTDSDEERPEATFELVDVNRLKDEPSNESQDDESQKTSLSEIEVLRKEIVNLKRKLEEREETICKIKALNESLAKDLHSERHSNLYLKNKLNLLEKEKEQGKYLMNGVGKAHNQIVLIITNDEKDKDK